MSQLRLHNLGHCTWVTNVKSILDKSELADLWDTLPSPSLGQHIRKHMELMYNNNWFNELNDSDRNPKLRLYKHVKSVFAPELYLYIHIEKYRFALSRLRLSSHHLAIEKGRHARPIIPAHLRFCLSCNTNVIDDETHFLIECPKFQNIRDHMLRTVIPLMPGFGNSSSQEKLIKLLTSQDIIILIAVGKFIWSAWKQ